MQRKQIILLKKLHIVVFTLCCVYVYGICAYYSGISYIGRKSYPTQGVMPSYRREELDTKLKPVLVSAIIAGVSLYALNRTFYRYAFEIPTSIPIEETPRPKKSNNQNRVRKRKRRRRN